MTHVDTQNVITLLAFMPQTWYGSFVPQNPPIHNLQPYNTLNLKLFMLFKQQKKLSVNRMS